MQIAIRKHSIKEEEENKTRKEIPKIKLRNMGYTMYYIIIIIRAEEELSRRFFRIQDCERHPRERKLFRRRTKSAERKRRRGRDMEHGNDRHAFARNR